LALLATVSVVGATAQQVGDPATLIKEKLVSQIKLTKASAAKDDIVTAGDVVTLHKDGLVMCATGSSYTDTNTYLNGVLKPDQKGRSADAGKKAAKSLFGKFVPMASDGSSVTDSVKNGCTERKFVSGENFWVTDIKLGKDAILVDTFSDPYNNVRYYGEISFPFPKGSVPPADDFVKTVSEVITVKPADDKSGGGDPAAQSAAPTNAAGAAPAQAAGAAPAQSAAPAPMAAIPPPPPAADAPPPTLEVGETTDQVVAGFGQPTRILKPTATRQIYIYKDMKVTFTNGKVSNIE